MKFVDPKNDVAFKKIFGNEEKKEILISFLNAVLDLQGEKEIYDIEILPPAQLPPIQYLKLSILDVRAKDKRGVTFIVEMQIAKLAGDKKRFQYYAAKTFVAQIERGENYPVLNITVLDYNTFDDEEDKEFYFSRHLFVNERTKKQQFKGLEFYFIELPKFTKNESELTGILDKWVYFIKHASNLDVVPESADTEALKAAYEVANRFSWSRDELEVYDYWGMKAQDERGKVQAALEEGLEQGIEKGIEKGRQGAQQKIVRSMLAKGLEPAAIAELTGISVEEITAFT